MKKRVNFTIEESVLAKLDKMAKDRGIDRSTMISVLIYDSAQIIELRDELGYGAFNAENWVLGLGEIK